MSDKLSFPSIETTRLFLDRNIQVKRVQFVTHFTSLYLSKLLFVCDKPEFWASCPYIKVLKVNDISYAYLILDVNHLVTILKILKLNYLKELGFNLKDLSHDLSVAGGWFVRYYQQERPYIHVFTTSPDGLGNWAEVNPNIKKVNAYDAATAPPNRVNYRAEQTTTTDTPLYPNAVNILRRLYDDPLE